MSSSIFEIMKSTGILPGTIVVSLAGHDEGRVYLVISRTDKTVRVADGRIRTYDNAKTKRVTHLKALGIILQPEEMIEKLAAAATEETKNIFIRNSINCFFEEERRLQGEVEHV
ncbi:MAG: hypothetical protein ACYCYM_10245 [Saccharofermentanales bacterium]